MLRENGLTFTQIRVLMELGEHNGEPVSLKELERLFYVAQPTVVGIVRRLEAKGLVEGFTSPDDNRVKLVGLTEFGRQFREMNARAIDEMENRLTSALTESERLEFLRMLRTVHESIK
jgi:DNA-binding MarR family transcriptional regulator